MDGATISGNRVLSDSLAATPSAAECPAAPMTTNPTFRPAVTAAREHLAAGRRRLHEQHNAGSPGIQVCAALTELLDEVVLEVFNAALADLAPGDDHPLRTDVALVAHGGYGRRDVAPYSDVDLMILHNRRVYREVAPLAKRLLHDLFDVGLALGQSVRTPEDACRLAYKDATIFTSLVESRWLAGTESLVERFVNRFRRGAQRRWRGMFGAIRKERAEERGQFGETVYLLEPNIKRSPGGLRDIQLLRWVGFARYGQAEPESLALMNVLAKDDQQALRSAWEFLLRLRNEMHFHAGKSADGLERAEQVRIAEVFGYEGAESLLPVEQFMRDYFSHTSAVRYIVARFVEGAQPWMQVREFFAPFVSIGVDNDYRIGPLRISATNTGLQKIKANLAETLRLMDLSNQRNKEIAHHTWKAVREAARDFPNEISSQVAERFLSLLEQPARLGPLLYKLHELGVLEKIIPEFAHARCLLQFNEYHKFTVDEHCIRAVEQATEFHSRRDKLGEVYRGIKEKRTLHLALLIHDLGKGHVEDHSELGARIANETAYRLNLPHREAGKLRFLVHKHLMMSHLAFRRDTSDEHVILQFAVEVGSPERLAMLFVLTCADLAAVGPGVLNDWKLEVLTDLYERTLQHLSGDSPTAVADRRRAALRTILQPEPEFPWFEAQIKTLPSSMLHGAPPQRVAEDLRHLRTVGDGEVKTWCRYLPETHTVEFTIGTHENITPGVFHKLTGALSGQGLHILSADINTLPGGLILDRFIVQDPDFVEEPPAGRIGQITSRLGDSLRSDQPPAFRRVWQRAATPAAAKVPALPTQVRIDNTTSEHYTILDVFATDRMGLLYTITRTLFELGLSVSLAKISTKLDQVVDVFYVTDQQGRKVHDENWLAEIRRRVHDAIAILERDSE
jgi:[protein-PII] uridylyltransferase